MRFRLVYEGPVRSVNRDAPDDKPDYMALHKHEMRVKFHAQLKRLWEVNKFLRETTVQAGNWPLMNIAKAGVAHWGSTKPEIPLRDAVGRQHPGLNGFRFVPLVLDQLQMLCALNILFLRTDSPEYRDGKGSVLSAGDLDNRIKTVIDALRPPKNPNEYVGRDNQAIVPGDGEDPLYCLLEDDNQVSHLSVEADRLLGPVSENAKADLSWAHVVITAELRPYHVTTLNLGLSS
jgi:hypothetical protein